MGWELFENYLIAKEKFKPDLFLYENNKSASQAIKDQIAKELGVGVDSDVRFTYINSALVSAQNRQRFYVIIVLSMYDGIATGRYCLDKMGFTNVTYHAYEIDKYPIMVAMDNYPDIIQHGDAFAVREDDWSLL